MGFPAQGCAPGVLPQLDVPVAEPVLGFVGAAGVAAAVADAAVVGGPVVESFAGHAAGHAGVVAAVGVAFAER